MNNESVSLSSINLTYIAILVAVSFLQLSFKEHTAYVWPAIDMAPFFERYFDISFLVNDFYTNSISNEPNPRWTFGYFVIGLSELLQTGWYTVSYFLQVILTIFMPVLYYLILYLAIVKFISSEKLKDIQIVILIAVLLGMQHNLSSVFSIAGWYPYFVQATPQSISLFFGFIAIILNEINSKSKTILFLMYVLFLFSTLMHPVIGLFVILFYFIFNYASLSINYFRYVKIVTLGFILPIIIIKALYSAAIISAPDFVNIYVLERHPHHYHLADFISPTSFGWIYHFASMFALLLIPILYFFRSKNQKSLLLTILFLVSYVLAVLLQYIFIDIYPNKLISSIGPVRFTQFAYWMIVISWAIMLSNLNFLQNFNFNFNFQRAHLVILTVIVVIASMLMIDRPEEDIYNKDKDVYDFVKHTEKNSVFAVYSGEFNIYIPNIGRRAVFVSRGLPFHESYFKEYQDRRSLLYGSRKNTLKSFFRRLSPGNFLNISEEYKLNYVVIESNYSSSFSEYKPIFANKKIKIYKISDFKEKN